MSIPRWVVVYGFAPTYHEDGTIESDDTSTFLGTEKEADEFFQEMLFDGSYPLLIKAQMIEYAIKQDRDEVCNKEGI